MKKIIIILILLSLLGLVGWQFYPRAMLTENRPERRRPAVAVELGLIQTGLIRKMGHYTGTLKAGSRFIVAPKASGRLKKLLVNIGDRVERGQLVVQIVDDEYRLQVEQARAALDVARASLAEAVSNYQLAEKEANRAKALSGKQIVSQSELDTAQFRFKAAKSKKDVASATVAQKAAALKQAEVLLSYTQIRAEWEGGADVRYVGERFMDEGTLLTVNSPIVSILELDVLIGEIFVIEREFPYIRVGQTAVVKADALPGRTFRGKVVRVAPVVDQASRQARVELEIPNPDFLIKPGMFIRAEIEFDRKTDAVLVPLTALASRDGRQGVFLADKEKMTVRFVPVELGIQEGDRVEVREPLISGSVVVTGHHLLEDGAAFILPGAKSGGPAKPGPNSGAASDRSRP